MADKSLNDCNIPNPFDPSNNIDPPAPFCPDCSDEPTLNNVPFFQDILKDKTGIGHADLCDPFQTGQITEDFRKPPNRNVVYRYSKAKRGCDEAMMDLFRDIIVIDEQGSTHAVPIIWATQERAVAAIVQENIRKDDSLVVDRIKLPMLAMNDSDFSFDSERYTYHRNLNYRTDLRPDQKPGFTIREKYNRDTIFGQPRGIPVNIGYQLFAWTLYKEDMNQIVEQIMLKFSPIAYIRVQGVYWETIVKLESVANNENLEPGNTALRVIKWQFNFKAETYIPQPLARKKAVLKTKVDIVNAIDENEITEVIAKLEEVANELKL
jgi:T4-like virus Myoviridae tail sheath stabiliser